MNDNMTNCPHCGSPKKIIVAFCPYCRLKDSEEYTGDVKLVADLMKECDLQYEDAKTWVEIWNRIMENPDKMLFDYIIVDTKRS